MSPLARALRNADAASHGAIAAVSLHVLHAVLNLIVACRSISPRPPRRPKFDCCVRFEPGGPGDVAHALRASFPRAASGSRWRSSCRRRGAASLASQRRSKARRLTRRHAVYLKPWYCFYIRLQYQRLRGKKVRQTRKPMCTYFIVDTMLSLSQ